MEINKIKEILQEHERRLIALEQDNTPRNNRQRKRLSEREFLKQINPEDLLELATAAAYYLERYDNKPSTTVEECAGFLRRAKEPQPKNLNDVMNRAVKKGLLMEVPADGRKAWETTNNALEWIESLSVEEKSA